MAALATPGPATRGLFVERTASNPCRSVSFGTVFARPTPPGTAIPGEPIRYMRRTIAPQRGHRGSVPVLTALASVLVFSTALAAAGDWRTIDGTNNHATDPEMGAAETPLARLAGHMYGDFVSAPAGTDRPSAREISNAVADQVSAGLNEDGLTDYVWLWGQFLDHDLDLTETASPAEPFDIEVPRGDPFFDPGNTGRATIGFNRSAWKAGTGTSRTNPRRQMNDITSWIDASNVYGSDETRAEALRKGRGQLRTSKGKLLPRNTRGLPNAGGTGAHLYLAGDVRANEQVALTAMHTLWVREHNRLAKQIRRDNPGMSGNEIYQRARAKVGALMQAITYNEFLPVLLGDGAIAPYRGFDPRADGSVAQEFSTAAYRFGHSMVSPRILRLKRNGRPISQGHLALRTPSSIRMPCARPVSSLCCAVSPPSAPVRSTRWSSTSYATSFSVRPAQAVSTSLR